MKKLRKTFFFAAVMSHSSWARVFKSETIFPLRFPKDSKNIKFEKSLDIGPWEVGAKIPLNRAEKVWLKDIRTFWLIERMGPEDRFFEDNRTFRS